MVWLPVDWVKMPVPVMADNLATPNREIAATHGVDAGPGAAGGDCSTKNKRERLLRGRGGVAYGHIAAGLFEGTGAVHCRERWHRPKRCRRVLL